MKKGDLKSKKPLIFVTGKGGVGKSVWALSLARKLAKSGKKTLLVEFGDSSFYGHFLSREVEYKANPLEANLDIARWDGATCLREYITHIVKVAALTKLFFDNRVMSALLKGAPALKELALLGKATSGPRHHGPQIEYDHIVFDCYSTGHFLALLRAPSGIYEAIKMGPMGEQSLAISNTMKNPSLCEFNIVTLAEDLPVSESIELAETLKSEFAAAPVLICNRLYEMEASFLAADKENPFIKTILHQIEIQKIAKGRLNQVFQDQVYIPYYFELDPFLLTDKIGGAME